MKTLLAAAAIAFTAGATLTLAGPVSAQTYQPMPSTMAMSPSWMQDDGSSSDYPIHNPGDVSGERMNRAYSGGIYTAPGHGFPAYPGEE